MTFAADYFTARDQFRQAAAHERLRETFMVQHEVIPVAARGPHGEELTMDIVKLKRGQPQALLILTSGLHGSEGLFGSAVQVAALERWAAAPPPESMGVLLIHALNPYGFAWMRRANKDNIDLNRNFLLPGEKYEGAPPLYRELDPLLNPQRPPSRWEPFQLKAYWFIARHGLPALMQAIASGQYEFPKGLFYGGSRPSETLRILQERLPHWLADTHHVLHLDLHTGLGRRGTYKLLLDYALAPDRAAWLRQHFGADVLEANDAAKTAYVTRGSLGQWCRALFPDRDYTYFCAEFGTYPPLQVISGLRAENQAHFWDRPDSAKTQHAKARLQELLNPAAPAWRREVIRKSLTLVDQAMRALAS
jgi:hypothetical protein